MVLATRFPPDIRVEKEVSALQTEHQLFMLCPRRNSQASQEVWQDIHVQRVFSTPMRWWTNWQLMATCSSGGWKRAIYTYVKENQIDVLHVHDLPLLGEAIDVGYQLNIPVIADLHENYPQLLAEVQNSRRSGALSAAQIVQRYSVSVDRWRRYEAQIVPQATSVIVVIEEARERLLQLGIAPERIHLVANYTHLTDIVDSHETQPESASGELFNVVYAGGFAATRDLHTVVDAVALIEHTKMPGLRVLLMGGSGTELEALNNHVAQRHAQDRVVVLDWRPMKEVWEQIESSQVCLVPHVKSPHTDTTIPHKLFQYMARQRPVIVSNCDPLERIVRETHCGLVYPSGDAPALAKCLEQLYFDPELRLRMGEAGRLAVQQKYNWEKTAYTLLQLYRQLAMVHN